MNITQETRVLITGGTQGLGLSLGRRFAQEGAVVVSLARHAARNPSDQDGDIRFLKADVGLDEPTGIGIRAAALAGGPIDVLIHNASTLGPVPMPSLVSLDDSALSNVFEVNVLGPARLNRVLLGPMLARRRGLILAISSDAAVEAYPDWGAYGASKAALDQLHRVLRAELDGSGVSVSAVDPGEMDTKMHSDALPGADRASLQKPADVADRIFARILSGDLPPRWSAGAEAGA